MADVLEARHLTKHFRPAHRARGRNLGRGARVRAVDDVSFSLAEREAVALVGESGSGKSTVARLLARLERVTSGEILFAGEAVPARSGRSFRQYCRRVQLVLQDPYASLNPLHSVRHHLARPLLIHRIAQGRPGLQAELEKLLEQVNLVPADQYIDKLPHELSGGQRQRVAIARAIAVSPRVLLADEPVSMLDVSIRLGMLNLLADLKERLDLSILYITHDIASARYFTTRMLVMYAGQLVEGGPSEEVTQSPAHPYTRLLISSSPDPDRLGSHERGQARGEPPSLISPPKGCRFHPRCPLAMPTCREAAPPVVDLGGGHWARCWLNASDRGA